MKKYTDEQIAGVFDHKTSGVKVYLENEEEKPNAQIRINAKKEIEFQFGQMMIELELYRRNKKLPISSIDMWDMAGEVARSYFGKPYKEEDETTKEPIESATPKYKSIKIGDDTVDIDLENDLVYINDELVTPDADTPKHIIDVLRKVVPQVLKGEKEGE